MFPLIFMINTVSIYVFHIVINVPLRNWTKWRQRVSSNLVHSFLLSLFCALSFPTRAPQLPGGAGVKESACQYRRCTRRGFDPWFGKIPWRRKCQHSPVFSSGESHGQGSLADYTAHRVTKSRTRLSKHTKRSKRENTSKRCWLCIYWGHRMKTSSEYTALPQRETSSVYSIVPQS